MTLGEQTNRISGTYDERQKPTVAAISLPKSGGAIRGMGEKFDSNPVTGTSSMAIPIATSPGRSGFGPQLALTYDSGSGNSPFGFGWSLSLPSITRKTEKGLPQYEDVADSDVFILSGSEDLVPVFRQAADGSWIRDVDGRFETHEDEIDGYRVRRYRPRIEALFARIERWTNVSDPADVHWRSISRDNVLTVYGADSNSRIADPEDLRRIFSWLVCETRDDKGNGILYRYKAEDAQGVDASLASERNRGKRTANRYLKHVYYGNRQPLIDSASGRRPRFLEKTTIDAQIASSQWLFEVVLDYGEHDMVSPRPGDTGEWTSRKDPFSTYRSGFEVRTTRLCRRVLMFHHFVGTESSLVGTDCLVRSTDFTHAHDTHPSYAFLTAVTQTGYRRKSGGGYDQRSLPTVEFDYTKPVVQDKVENIDLPDLENLPAGLSGTYRWTDLHGEGVPGIPRAGRLVVLQTQSKPNRSAWTLRRDRKRRVETERLARLRH